jgi:hypothetical protein
MSGPFSQREQKYVDIFLYQNDVGAGLLARSISPHFFKIEEKSQNQQPVSNCIYLCCNLLGNALLVWRKLSIGPSDQIQYR